MIALITKSNVIITHCAIFIKFQIFLAHIAVVIIVVIPSDQISSITTNIKEMTNLTISGIYFILHIPNILYITTSIEILSHFIFLNFLYFVPSNIPKVIFRSRLGRPLHFKSAAVIYFFNYSNSTNRRNPVRKNCMTFCIHLHYFVTNFKQIIGSNIDGLNIFKAVQMYSKPIVPFNHSIVGTDCYHLSAIPRPNTTRFAIVIFVPRSIDDSHPNFGIFLTHCFPPLHQWPKQGTTTYHLWL